MKTRYKHQETSLLFMQKNPRVFDMSDAGTAKTRVQLDAFAELRRLPINKRCGKMLVLAPKTLLRNAWGDDAAEFVPDMKVSIAYATNREAAFKVDADIYITNTDAAKWLASQKPIFFKQFDRLVIDESTAYKHHTSARSRAVDKIKKYFHYRSMLTGLPNSRSITDLWHQVYLLDDGKRLGPNFFAFRSATCTPVQVGREAKMVNWEDKEGVEEAVADLISDITIRHKFDDCMDIPQTLISKRNYYLPPKIARAYKEMETVSIAFLKTGNVTAINQAAVRTKLLQISSGAVYSDSETYHLIDGSRYELVLDLVEGRKHSLVFYLWKHQRDEMVREAKARGIKYCVFDGEATDRAREEMKQYYQAGFYQVMFAHPKSAAHGLTLTKGTTTIWPSPTDDTEWWYQGNRRQRRAGQTQKTEVISILAEGTIETGVYENSTDIKLGRAQNLLAWFENKGA